jgi:hypothetical protein
MRAGILPLLLALSWAARASHAAGLEWVPDTTAQALFEGKARQVRAVFKNNGGSDFQSKLTTRLWQASSTTAVPADQTKSQGSLHIPPGETILKMVEVDLPAVRGQTPFLLQWADEQNTIIAKTSVIVFPLQLLKELKVLAGESGVGIMDPQNIFKPWFRKSEVDYTDLQSTELEVFTGKLVIFDGDAGDEKHTDARLLSKARKGSSILWIRHSKGTRLEPSSFLKRTSGAAIVVTDSKNFIDFDNNPMAHLNLTRLARWAVLADSMDLTTREIH